jgi:hypothetical protein
MLRPSVNQIASAYTGRMPALQEQVNKDRQANNGIPSDLRKMMALQDLLSDGQHMGIDQALKSPQNPPTVSQSLQDRARQILGTKMAQAQQGNAIAQKQQEAMVNQGRPGPVPAGIAQPPRQPEGIDQLESNVGESYANGGIVAFTTGDKVEDSAFVQNMKELAGKVSKAFTETEEEKQARLLKAKLQQQGAPIGYFTQGAGEYSKNSAVRDFILENPGIVNSPVFKADPVGYVTRAAENKRTAKPATVTPEENVNEAMRLAGKLDSAPAAVSEAVPSKAEAPAVNKPAAPSVIQPAAQPKPAVSKLTSQPGLANLIKSASELPPAEKGSPRDILSKGMNLDPDAEMNRILAAREKLVGAPDTSQYQALIEELRGQKTQLQKKPEPGFESLMEYFGEIAAGPTVGRSGKAGAQASERLRQRELEKQKQVNALNERMIETAQKQQDAVYGYKKEGFALSEGERARVFKERFDSAKAAGESDDRARTLAQQAVLEQAKIAAQLEAARIGASGRQGQLMDIAQGLIKADKTGKLDLRTALEQAAKIVGTSALAGTEVRNDQAFIAAKKALDEGMTGILRRGKGPTAKEAQREYEIELAKLEKMFNQTGSAGLNSLPAATGSTSSNVRSQADAIISGGR